jgi:sugar phosphate isomerase/epimerase
LINTGLVSVTFRKLTPKQVVKLVKKGGLDGIEWGGDIHVPHGDINVAREVSKITKEEGLYTAAYGSYYRVGCSNDFEAVLETAKELDAPTIRVWAGNKGSEKADENWWEKVIEESYRISEMSKKQNITISYEYHENTLTDTHQSAIKLLSKVNHPNLYTYWQPLFGTEHSLRIEGLKSVLPQISDIHVQYRSDGQTMSLSDGIELWEQYIEIIKEDKKQRTAMLEFVKDNDPEQFLKDAETLKNILK